MISIVYLTDITDESIAGPFPPRPINRPSHDGITWSVRLVPIKSNSRKMTTAVNNFFPTTRHPSRPAFLSARTHHIKVNAVSEEKQEVRARNVTRSAAMMMERASGEERGVV
ncbi:hypothetical protein L249_0410 [Ophiocordyceps polyrhachis-furcata BCC 54312]|uniref:Uncharacterized protein n=1 Tax=Ophiocordyceps polyrhachis-furcata BCC 54312 TaxID=1330021 RepID=A0A367LDJ4_9HYPO|nr:hypothetical protein L249_0410 [Ophiocordyceps polyrhachis-furcata BCC 54312]